MKKWVSTSVDHLWVNTLLACDYEVNVTPKEPISCKKVPVNSKVRALVQESESKDAEIERLKKRLVEVDTKRDALRTELAREKEKNDGILQVLSRSNCNRYLSIQVRVNLKLSQQLEVGCYDGIRVEIFKPRVGPGNRVIDEVAETQVKYNRLRKRIRESEAEHMEQHKADMEMINEWKDRAVKSSERLEYLEYSLMELEGKMRKRVTDCKNVEGNEGGHLEREFLLLNLRDLGELIDNSIRSREGPSRTK
ncbi:uncharacterized protein [Nicotiana sylvestris]|uniref:uncharacterized protein n=1 Tax=Nicotiana sylvestris TaxID=4096 RepID=UPI00388C99A8